MSEEVKKERREKLLELQVLDSQIKQIEEQMSRIEEQIFEVNSLIENLSELKNVKNGQEILVPVANGIFVKASVTDVNNIKVNVGSGVVVEKTLEETKEMLKEQIKSIDNYKDEMFAELQKLVIKASEIQAEILGGQ